MKEVQRLYVMDRPNVETGFIVPFSGERIQISQGYDGQYSHGYYTMKTYSKRGVLTRDIDHRFAIDFSVPFGTNVRASKDGVVFGIISDHNIFYEGIDLATGMGTPTNFIVIQHKTGHLHCIPILIMAA